MTQCCNLDTPIYLSHPSCNTHSQRSFWFLQSALQSRFNRGWGVIFIRCHKRCNNNLTALSLHVREIRSLKKQSHIMWYRIKVNQKKNIFTANKNLFLERFANAHIKLWKSYFWMFSEYSKHSETIKNQITLNKHSINVIGRTLPEC